MRDLLADAGLHRGTADDRRPLAVRLWSATACRRSSGGAPARTRRLKEQPHVPSPSARCAARPRAAVRRRHGQPRAGHDAGRRAGLLGPGELHRRAEPVAARPGARHPPRLLRGRRRHGGDQHVRRLAGHAGGIRPRRPRLRDQPARRRTGARGGGAVLRRPASLGDRQRRAGHQAAEPGQHRLRPAGGGAGRAMPRPDRRRRRCDPDRDLPGHAADQGGGERRQDRARRGGQRHADLRAGDGGDHRHAAGRSRHRRRGRDRAARWTCR